MAITSYTDNMKCWQADGATGTLLIAGGNVKCFIHLEDNLAFSYKTKHIH